MPFRTNNITAAEYRNMDMIICVEYEDMDTPSDKFLKIIVGREYDEEMINIFEFDTIPEKLRTIYDYCKNNSYIDKESESCYNIYGKKIHKQNATYQRLLSRGDDPLGMIRTKIDEENKIGHIDSVTSDYYNLVADSIPA